MYKVAALQDYQKGSRELAVEIQGGLSPAFKEDIWYTLRFMGVNYPVKLSDPQLGPRPEFSGSRKPQMSGAAAPGGDEEERQRQAREDEAKREGHTKHHDATPKGAPVPGGAPAPTAPTPGKTETNPATGGPSSPSGTVSQTVPGVQPKGNVPDTQTAKADQVGKEQEAQIQKELDDQKEARRQEQRATFQAEVNDFNSRKEQQLSGAEGDDGPGGTATVTKRRILPRATDTGIAGSIMVQDPPAGSHQFDENVSVILQMVDPLNDFMKKGSQMTLAPRQ